MITEWVEAAGLTLHPTKTKIADSRSESFAFLGYSFRGDKIYPRRESLAKMKARIKELTPPTFKMHTPQQRMPQRVVVDATQFR